MATTKSHIASLFPEALQLLSAVYAKQQNIDQVLGSVGKKKQTKKVKKIQEAPTEHKLRSKLSCA